jgi:hypothetical protein
MVESYVPAIEATYAREDRTGDQHDALHRRLALPRRQGRLPCGGSEARSSAAERTVAQVEGWIVGPATVIRSCAGNA